MQTDFFEDTVFETRSASDTYDFDLFRSRVKRGMSKLAQVSALGLNESLSLRHLKAAWNSRDVEAVA